MSKPITLQSLIDDLEAAKAKALQNNQINSVISAIALQAKLLGLDKGEPPLEEVKPVQVVVQVKDARRRGG